MIFNSTNNKFFFYYLPVFLFSLLPLFLITGPFLSDLSISLISLLFLIYCFKEKKFSYFKNKYFYFFLIFWIYLIINSLINNFNLDSLKISFFYFRYGVFVIAIISLLKFDEKFLKYFFYCIFLCFTILIVDGFFEYSTGKNLLGWDNMHPTRVSSLFNDELILGSYLSRLWPIFFGLSILYIKKKDKLFFLIILIFILSEVLIFLSGERAAFFYINLSAIFIIIFSNKLMRLRLITLLSSLFLIIIIAHFNPLAKERIIDKTIKQLNIVNVDGKINLADILDGVYIFSRQHTHHYISSYRMFLDNKVLGVGVKNFRNYCNSKKYKVSKLSCATHPHNTYIQILAETGIIGFIFIIFIFLYFLKKIFLHLLLKFKKKTYFNDFEICILSGILLYLWPFVPTGNVFNNWLNIIFFLYFPFLAYGKKLNKN